jgi:phosphopantetheinyl transferase
MRNNDNRDSHQRRLPFENQEVWAMLPEEVRERCRSLCSQLLARVLQKGEGRPNERED